MFSYVFVSLLYSRALSLICFRAGKEIPEDINTLKEEIEVCMN